MYAYLNESGDIVGLSTDERTLAEAQAVNPDISSVEADPSQEDVDAFKASLLVAERKREMFSQIDGKTDQLIAGGFPYAGHQFSLSLASQMKMVGAHAARDEAAMVYPIVWNTLGDEDVYSIASSADLNGFYLTAVGTLRAFLDSGTALKNQVREATTKAELDAVTDDR